jgi:hypothetical protein
MSEDISANELHDLLTISLILFLFEDNRRFEPAFHLEIKREPIHRRHIQVFQDEELFSDLVNSNPKF